MTPQPVPQPCREPRTSDGSTSRSLLAAAQQDDQSAWSRLVTLYTPLVASWCHRWGVPRQDAMDIVQDVFAAVASNLERFRKERPQDTFRGWLATISRNKVRDYYRRRIGEPLGAGGTEAAVRLSQVCDWSHFADESDDGEQFVFSEVLYRALETIRGDFHQQTWQAFWQTVVEGKPATVVAAEMNLQPGAVRVSKSRVLCRLRKELGDEPSLAE